MSHIGNEGSDVSDDKCVVIFMCKKCGKVCTEAERDSHRAMHNQQEQDRAPSPIQSACPAVSQEDVTAAPEKRPSRLAKRKAAAALETPKPERKPRKARAKPIKRGTKDGWRTLPDLASYELYRSRTPLKDPRNWR